MHRRAPSTSAYVQRISSQQNAIEARLVDLEGMDALQDMLRRTKIKGEDDMNIDGEDEEPPAPSRAVETKRRVLARFVRPFLSLISIQARSTESHFVIVSLNSAIP